MKQLLIIAVSVITVTNTTSAQYQPAGITGYTYPPSPLNVNQNCSNTSAYSCGNFIDINSGNVYDLSVHTWDVGDMALSGNAGFAVIEYTGGINAEDYITYPANQVHSLEAVILEENGIPYIFVSYYDNVASQFMYDLYEWNNTNIIPVSTGNDVTGTGSSFSFSWIRCDANQAKAVIVAWEDNGVLYSRAGFITSIVAGPTYIDWGEYVTLLPILTAATFLHNVDVALQNVSSTPAPVTGDAYFTYTDVSNQMLGVSVCNFSAIYGNITPGAFVVLTLLDQQFTTSLSETWGIPRIDAYDVNTDLWWSYVAVKTDPVANSQIVTTGIGDGSTVLGNYELNNGSLPGSPLGISTFIPGIIETKTPVVAFDNSNHVYYTWYYQDNIMPILGVYNQAYIGFRIDIFGNVTTPNYLIAQVDPDKTSDFPSIALSTENYQSPELFMAYTQYDVLAVPVEYYMDSKKITWGSTSFRPDTPNNVKNIHSDQIFTVYPNPFSNRMQLLSEESSHEEFSVYITDLTGRIIWHFKGDLNSVNQKLSKQSEILETGIYLIKLNGEKNIQTLKIVKSK